MKKTKIMMAGVLIPAAILGINIVYVAHTENNGLKNLKNKKVGIFDYFKEFNF